MYTLSLSPPFYFDTKYPLAAQWRARNDNSFAYHIHSLPPNSSPTTNYNSDGHSSSSRLTLDLLQTALALTTPLPTQCVQVLDLHNQIHQLVTLNPSLSASLSSPPDQRTKTHFAGLFELEREREWNEYGDDLRDEDANVRAIIDFLLNPVVAVVNAIQEPKRLVAWSQSSQPKRDIVIGERRPEKIILHVVEAKGLKPFASVTPLVIRAAQSQCSLTYQLAIQQQPRSGPFNKIGLLHGSR